MPTKSLPGSFYQRNGRWWWGVTLPGETARKCIPLVPVGQKKATEDRIIAQAVAEQIFEAARIRANADDSFDGTVGNLCERYKAHADAYYGEGSERANIDYALAPLLELYAKMSADQFGPLTLQKVRDRWINRTIDGKPAPLCRSTINDRTRIIKLMFGWGSSQELVPASVAMALKLVAGLHKGRTAAKEPRKVPAVPAELVEATLPHMTPTLRAMVEVQQLTGMRGCEIWHMKPRHIERTPAGVGGVWFYNVPPEGNKSEFRNEKAGDTSYSRRVPLAKRVQEILTPFMLRGDDEFLFTPEQSERERRAVQRANRKTPLWKGHLDRYAREAAKRAPIQWSPTWDKGTYRRAIHAAVGRANAAIRDELRKAMPKAKATEFKEAFAKVQLPKWNPHQLRHLVATVASGMGEMARDGARALLGHKTADMTDYYRRIEDAKAVDAAQFVANRFAKKTGTTERIEG